MQELAAESQKEDCLEMKEQLRAQALEVKEVFSRTSFHLSFNVLLKWRFAGGRAVSRASALTSRPGSFTSLSF